jgi:hypothetical protein
MASLTPSGVAPDIGAFLERLTRLDRQALVRVRSVGSGRIALWGRVPWGVLVTRTAERSALVDAPETFDITVRGAAWLSSAPSSPFELPRMDASWGTPIPASAGKIRETIDNSVVREIAAAAATTLRAVGAGALGERAIGERAIRDALLDHVPIVVESDGEPIEISQRLIQAVVRMGFLSSDAGAVRIQTVASWVGISAAYGVAWRRAQNAENPTLLPAPSRL